MSRPLALVTGGAGLIGSHVVDRALAEGWRVRVLDNLQRQTHPHGKPPWLPDAAEFLRGDVRRRRVWEAALDGVDVVFHQAAWGGYMPQIAKFVETNGVGTALLLETIRDQRLPVRKIVVASSQAVYNEGAYACPSHGRFFGRPRPVAQLERADWAVRCPACGAPGSPAPTPEDAPTGGENVYAISKMTQERLSLAWGESTGIPVVALRYSCTYGPRQSLANPYTGVIAIFCTRLANGLPPVVYEDGRQSRDLVFVGDVARANLLAAGDARADGLALNIGSGVGTEIGALAALLADRLGVPVAAELPGTFRPGELRALVADTTGAAAIGFAAETPLAEGVDRYLAWVRTQGSVREYFAAAERRLRQRNVVRQSLAPPGPAA